MTKEREFQLRLLSISFLRANLDDAIEAILDWDADREREGVVIVIAGERCPAPTYKELDELEVLLKKE